MLPSLTVVQLRRAVSRHRSLLAAGLAAGSLAAALGVVSPHPSPGVAVLSAGRDLAAGTALAPGDLRVVHLPTDLAPAGALVVAADAVGRVLAAPLRRGEPVTDVRLAGSDLLAGQAAGLVAVPVRIADAASASLVVAGDRVDILAATSSPDAAAAARVVALDTVVLAVPTVVRDDGEGALIVVAATPSVAARLAAAAVTGRLSVTLRARA